MTTEDTVPAEPTPDGPVWQAAVRHPEIEDATRLPLPGPPPLGMSATVHITGGWTADLSIPSTIAAQYVTCTKYLNSAGLQHLFVLASQPGALSEYTARKGNLALRLIVGPDGVHMTQATLVIGLNDGDYLESSLSTSYPPEAPGIGAFRLSADFRAVQVTGRSFMASYFRHGRPEAPADIAVTVTISCASVSQGP